MKNKKTVLIVVAFVVAIALMVGIYFAARPQAVAGSKTITVEVVHGDGSSKTFTYHTDEEYLGQVLVAEDLVETEDGPYGIFIKAVDGEKAVYEEDNAYWALYVGEEYATYGADQTVIQDGDAFRLVCEAASFE